MILANHHTLVIILILLLSLAGLADALYFTFAYYGRIRHMKWIPEILCAREGSSCVTVVQTPYARVFGLPNSLLGAVYYALLIAWVGWGTPVGFAASVGDRTSIYRIGWLLITISAATVALGFYLIYALRRKLHVDCPLCYAGHAINLALFVLLILNFTP